MTSPDAIKRDVAIVTGASSGIGKLYADRLAARGYDVVLVARREDRLRDLAALIRHLHGVKAEVLVADLSQPDGVAAVVSRIENDPAISMLVNNAGFSVLRPLTRTTTDVITSMLGVNVMAVTLLSRAALSAFTARNTGTLVNIGSAAGIAPYPGIPVYGATKAYINQFTRSLQSEVAGTNVRVQLVLPGAVQSEGWDVAGGAALEPLPPSIVMSTGDCVDAALAGLDRGELVTCPSLKDEGLLQDYQTRADGLLQSMFDSQPAARYGISR